MQISTKDWKNYIEKLSRLNKEAGDRMSDYVAKNGFDDPDIIDYAYGLVTKYSEGSSALSALMYDTIAELEGKKLPRAEVAPTPEYGEVAKAINGIKKHSENPNSYGNAVDRLVKRTGADTILRNAERDGAEFAWVPSGDSCAFCIALASRGWQHVSKDTLKNGHAEHIHANCNCEYAIRFDGKSTVAGYNPEEYLEIYESAEGDTPKEKINSIRAKYRAENSDKINAQKREAYYLHKKDLITESNQSIIKVAEQGRRVPGNNVSTIISPFIETQGYDDKMRLLQENENVTAILTHQARTALYHRNGTLKEDLVYINPITEEFRAQRHYNVDGECVPTEKMIEMVNNNPRTIIAMHNHPQSMLPSYKDLENAKHYKYGVIACHNGNIIKYTVSDNANIEFADMLLNDMQDDFDDIEKRKQHIDMIKSVGVLLEVF